MKLAKLVSIVLTGLVISGCKTVSLPKSNPGGDIEFYNTGSEIPQNARPNDATISYYEELRSAFIGRLMANGNIHSIAPKGNAQEIKTNANPQSKTLEKELTDGYILSYLYYEDGEIKYNGLPVKDRFQSLINDKTLFFTHSSGKSIVSYIAGHAICRGYIESLDEVIDWPMMKNTLYQGQRIRDLLNMSAGDSHIVEGSSVIIKGLGHHRHFGLDTIANHIQGSKKIGNEVFYNNFLTDVIANYIAFRAGDNYNELLRSVFQDSIGIENEVHFELHPKTLTNGAYSGYYGENQTRASYSFFITRKDFLRFGIALMRDYQNNTCVGQYLREVQNQARTWTKYRPSSNDSMLWIHSYARKYGGQFYFDFDGMRGRNIFGTEGKNGQNILIDMDNSRVLVTNSAATAWDQRHFMLNVIRTGKLPE